MPAEQFACVCVWNLRDSGEMTLVYYSFSPLMLTNEALIKKAGH